MTGDPVADPLYVEAHLGYVFGQAIAAGVDGIVVVSEPVGEKGGRAHWRSGCYRLDEIDAAARYCVDRSNVGANVYVRSTLLVEPVPIFKRGTAKQTGWVTHLLGDLDIAGAGHQPAADGLPLPPTIEFVEAIADAVLPPSYVISSGGGTYPVWRLSDAIDVRDPDRYDELRSLSRDFNLSLVEVARGAGYHVDNVGDLSRVSRPVGVINHKPGRDPRPVTVRLGAAMGAGDYTLEQLRGACLPSTTVVRTPPKRSTRPAGTPTVWDVVAELYTLEDILDADRRFGPWESAGEDSTFDYWVRAGSSSDYSIKQNQATGVVIVWSSVVAAALGVQPGCGLDLFGFACRLDGTDPRGRAVDIMRRARARRSAIA